MKEKRCKTMKKALCSLLAMSILVQNGGAVHAEQPDSGAKLIAYYDFEDASGTKVPNRVNGDSYEGVLHGAGAAITEKGVLGKSLNLNGSEVSWMQIDDIVNSAASSYSFSLWYQYDTSVDRGNKRVVLLQQNGSGRTLLTLQSNNQYHTYVNTQDVSGNKAINPDEWQHVTFVSNAETKEVTWYVNGELDSTKAGGNGSINELTDLLVGCHKNGQDDPMYLRGLVDEIKIYEGVVTAEEAKAIYEEKADLIREDEKEPEDGDLDKIILTADPESVERTIDDSIFGINHRYAFNGYGSFDSENKKVKDDFRVLYEEAGFGSIRYPGGTISNLFHWKTTLDSVGRKKQIHGFYNNAGQGGIEPNFGIKEIADFADEVNSEIVYVYSLGRGSVQDAEDLIEYLNAEVGTNPNGGIDWAAVRSENGHPEPYHVRYFEIGNEMQQVYADGTSSQGYWLHGMTDSETGYIEGGTAKFTNQYAVCEEDWNQQASKSDGSANLVRYMRYANTNPKTYDAEGKIVDDDSFEAVVKGSVSVFVGSEKWEIVDSLEESSPTDRHVVVDYATGALKFGDGVHGAIPAAGQQINVSYSVERDGFVAISKAIKETTEKINQANAENGVTETQEAYVYSSYETSGFISKMSRGGYDQWYDGLTIHPYSGTPSGSGGSFYDSAMSLAESAGIQKVKNYVNMLPEGKVPVISEYGIFRSTDSLVRSQTHAIYIAKVLMEYVRLGSPYIQKHCLIDWYSSGADSLGPTQQAVIQAVAQNGASTATGEGDFAFFATPSARVFQMLNSSFGTEILTGEFSAAEKLNNGVQAYSALVSKDDCDNYYAAIVNVDREHGKTMELNVKGVDLTGKEVEIQLLSSSSFADENTLENPDRVKVTTTAFVNEKSSVKFELPKHSFAVIKVCAAEDKVVRISGKTRYETGICVANKLKAVLGVDKFDAAVIATGTNYADALAGSYLAKVKNAPILLTNSTAEVNQRIAAYVEENVKEDGTVYILGGNNAVSMSLDKMFKGNIVVDRLRGETRYETNALILNRAELEDQTELIVVTGKDYADSLSASAAGKPLLLVHPTNALTAEQKSVLKAFKNGKIYLIGGEAAISERTKKEISDCVGSSAKIERIFGFDRYVTSVNVAKEFFTDADKAVLAVGNNYPDGLCGGALAAALNAPLILTKAGSEDAAAAYVAANRVKSGYILGGTTVMPDETVVKVFALESAAEIIK